METRKIVTQGISTGLRLGRGTADRVVKLAGESDLAVFTADLPHLCTIERDAIKAAITASIAAVEAGAVRGRVLGLDRLGELTQIERDLGGVLDQIKGALA